MKKFIFTLLLLLPGLALADTVTWSGPTKPITIGLSQDDIAQVMFPEPITYEILENPEYIEGIQAQGYNGRAFNLKSNMPKMATRGFFTGQSGNTYIVIFTTDVPYRAYTEIVNGLEVDAVKKAVAGKFGPADLVRAMAQDTDVPGFNRETYVVPNWLRGNGLTFDLTEVWQSPTLTGVVAHVRNEYPQANEVNLPAITIPKTNEWGVLRYASMENLRLAPAGQPNDKGVLFLVFVR